MQIPKWISWWKMVLYWTSQSSSPLPCPSLSLSFTICSLSTSSCWLASLLLSIHKCSCSGTLLIGSPVCLLTRSSLLLRSSLWVSASEAAFSPQPRASLRLFRSLKAHLVCSSLRLFFWRTCYWLNHQFLPHSWSKFNWKCGSFPAWCPYSCLLLSSQLLRK